MSTTMMTAAADPATKSTTPLRVAAVLSMLGEDATRNSATRLFRGSPVLRWTLDRLARAARLSHMAVLCWEDQLPAVVPIAEDEHVDVLAKGPRKAVPELDRVTAARKWADGWRGGLLSTCDFDAGFYGPWVAELAAKLDVDAVLLVPPSGGLIDFDLVDRLVDHAAGHPPQLIFSPAAPGLGGAIVRRELLEKLAAARTHPGRFLHYMPEDPHLDPVGGDACVAVPAAVSRTAENFRLDSDRRIARVTSAAVSLNGSLIRTGGEEISRRLSAEPSRGTTPRDVTLELTTRRDTRPVYSPCRHLTLERPDLSVATATALLSELGRGDDVRLTLGGVGDPLCSPHVWDVLAAAKNAGVHSVHVETDLAGADESRAAKLAAAAVDVVSVFLPALTPATYAAVMGADAYARVLNNVRTFVAERQARTGGGVPIFVPTFVKLAANLAEMDAWYDQWLNAVGTAVIIGPSDCGGQVPNVAVADMQPGRRGACARLSERLAVLSDGTIVPCDQDVTGRQPLGMVGRDTIADAWQNRMESLRQDHAAGQWAKHPVCAGCKEWFRR